jgi:tetratricopeptide (TPR) repeat protein
MARFEKTGGKSAKPNAPVARPTAAPSRPKSKPTSYEDTMFFTRLRRHAKWMFVLLALVLGLGLVIAGVGAGGVGVLDVFRGGGGGGTSVSDARKKTEENPQSVAAWQELATAYQAAGNEDGYVSALVQASALRPKDVGILGELAGAYQLQATSKQELGQRIFVRQAYFLNPSNPAPFSVKNEPVIGQDPIAAAVQAATADRISTIQTQLTTARANAVSTYEKIVELQPDDPNVRLQLAQLAATVGNLTASLAAYKEYLELAPDDARVLLDYAQTAEAANEPKTAISAYQRFLKLAPDDTNASFAKDKIAELRKAQQQSSSESAQSGGSSG